MSATCLSPGERRQLRRLLDHGSIDYFTSTPVDTPICDPITLTLLQTKGLTDSDVSGDRHWLTQLGLAEATAMRGPIAGLPSSPPSASPNADTPEARLGLAKPASTAPDPATRPFVAGSGDLLLDLPSLAIGAALGCLVGLFGTLLGILLGGWLS